MDFFLYIIIFVLYLGINSNNYCRKLLIMLNMMLADSRIVLTLDFLLIETAISNSALMLNNDVIFFTFLFSHMNSSPVARMLVDASRKGSSPVSSSLRDLTSVIGLDTSQYGLASFSVFLSIVEEVQVRFLCSSVTPAERRSFMGQMMEPFLTGKKGVDQSEEKRFGGRREAP